MSDCQTCAFKRDKEFASFDNVEKYLFGISWLSYRSLEVITVIRPVCYALPEPVKITSRIEEKCAYYTEAK